ncbi:MAG: argininosuccinate synthase [Thermodesulfobacteriota bacterium]|nr:argininosuccinate synthase [Thermodesulfobacteriota bacterium]
MAVDGVRLSPAALLARLNELGGANGVGRVDMVANESLRCMSSRSRVMDSRSR